MKQIELRNNLVSRAIPAPHSRTPASRFSHRHDDLLHYIIPTRLPLFSSYPHTCIRSPAFERCFQTRAASPGRIMNSDYPIRNPRKPVSIVRILLPNSPTLTSSYFILKPDTEMRPYSQFHKSFCTFLEIEKIALKKAPYGNE